MPYRNLLKFGAALMTGGTTLAFVRTYGGEHDNFFSKPFFTAFAATVEATRWDDNWDKRAHDKPTATRHIILIRHGQYNLAGKSDAGKSLTEMGKEQAAYTAQRLKALGLNKKVTVIVESTMTRAKETCRIIYKEMGLGDEGIQIESTDLLREGAPVDPEPPVAHWKPDPQSFFVDGARIETAFRHYIHRADSSQKNDSVEIIVCHANVIRYFVCRVLQLPPEAWLRMSLRHASITQLSIRPNGRVSLKALGDAGHLPPDKLTFE